MKSMLAISNHSVMLGGGEHSFLDLLSCLPSLWKPIAVVPEIGELAVRLQKKKVKIEVIPLPALKPWLIYKILSCFATYFAVCKRYHPDLIYANGSRAAFYACIIGRILRLPVVWHCRIINTDKYLDFILTRLSKRIVVNSQATAKRFKERFQTKVTVVYNGLDLQSLRENALKKPDQIRDDWKIILVVARISKWKRHDLVLSAFELIAESNPEVHLVCLGGRDASDPKWWACLEQMTKRSRFSDRIHWMGQVDDVRPWYRNAHVLVLPSENEPFGRVLVEALACGIPVVATSGGGVPEIVRNGIDGIMVSDLKSDDIADGILKILDDKILGKKISVSGKQRAEDFSIEAHINQMTKIFQEVIKEA
jgi:glycosyltransferase involved in cell wall biosynthesis